MNPVDWATLVTSIVASVLGSSLIVGLLTWWLDRRRFGHQQAMDVSRLELDRWQQVQQSFEKEIDTWEKAGDSANANETRREYALQQVAWRAQQRVTGLAPREVRLEGGTSLAAEEVAELRRLLAASAGLNPGVFSAEDHFLRGNSYFETGQYQQALAEYNRALELRPDHPGTLYNRGVALVGLGHYDEALADLNRALELRPDDPNILNSRGSTMGYLGRYEEALADFNRALALRPDDPGTPYNRGLALSNLSRHQEALAAYSRALEMRPDHPDTLNNRGNTLVLLGRPQEALADYSRALKLRPDHPGTLYNLACLFALTQRYQEALDWLQRAINGDASVSGRVVKDPAFGPLRDHPQLGPRFRRLVGGDSGEGANP